MIGRHTCFIHPFVPLGIIVISHTLLLFSSTLSRETSLNPSQSAFAPFLPTTGETVNGDSDEGTTNCGGRRQNGGEEDGGEEKASSLLSLPSLTERSLLTLSLHPLYLS